MAATARLGGARRGDAPSGMKRRGSNADGNAIIQHLQEFIDAFMWQADAATLEITFATTSAFEVTGRPSDNWTGPARSWLAHIYPRDRRPGESFLRGRAAH